jgi:hypothetical protein
MSGTILLAAAPHIDIRIINRAEAPPEVVARAQQIVANVYSVAGIQVRWQESNNPSTCQPAQITVVINPDATRGSTRTALGISFPLVGEGGRAGVFYSRIERVSRDPTIGLGASVAEVLAYVMVHEIGHLVLNWTTHSRDGIMRTNWTLVEFAAMRGGKLFFAAAEASALRRAFQKRRSACADPASSLTANRTGGWQPV